LREAEGRTADSLTKLYERLARIDAAGQSLDDLSKEVVSLQQVLADKQMRGAFGQMRMEAILEDGLPRTAFELQATLSNGKRPDALIRLPSAPAPLAVDAKFPLEGYEALRVAATPEARIQAMARFRDSVTRHVDDIAAKYLIPGETQDMALMFVPSEAVYAELHERLPELIQRAYRARVVIVSPNMLMLAMQTMQAIFKDVRMREQAGLIQREVGHLMTDVARLAERAQDLDKHFTLAAKDVAKLLTSSEKITLRAKRIDGVDLAEEKLAAPRLAAGE
jgi:DNA recombination protein RmuC